jgi:SAM-dependent methyltransferase
MRGCEGYGAIARVYDRLNAEIDYTAWADFIEKCFDRFLRNRPELVLDLACGTGSMTLPLAARGYDMIGVDGSADMLSEAYRRAAGAPRFLQQEMRAFELYGTVGAVTCCLDSLNYLLTDADLSRCFSCVHTYLDPDGLFLFDMNTPYKFRHIYGDNAYILEDTLTDEDGEEPLAVYCGWQNFFHADTGICDFDLSLFEELPDGTYRRSDEHQRERCYELSTIRNCLTAAGLELLGVWSDFSFSAPTDTTERWYFCARAKK